MSRRSLRTDVGDLDGDNDLLIGSDDGVQWFENQGTQFAAGVYEQGVTGRTSFLTSDFNGDGEFNSADLVAALQAGTYSW